MTLRRSIHFVPGGVDKMLDKALNLPADSLVLDLEDSVTAERKLAAREAVCEWLASAEFGEQEKLVRINPMDSEWGSDDLAAVLAHRPDGIVVPKVLDLKAVQAMDQQIVQLQQTAAADYSAIKLLLIGSESAAAVFKLHEMAQHERVSGLTWGVEDLSVSLGARGSRDDNGNYLEVFSFVRSMCLLSAAAAQVQPIDAVYADIKNTEGLRRECKSAADMGFTAKLTIHPDQIEIVNEAFTPSPAEVEAAAALVAAFAEHCAEGKMAFKFEGAMVDMPHLRRAEQILALAAREKSAS